MRLVFTFIVCLVVVVLAVSATSLPLQGRGTPPGTKVRHLHQVFRAAQDHLFAPKTARSRLDRSQSMESFNTSALPSYGYVNVLSYGAVPDGKTDNTAAFAAALNAGTGGKVFVPPGQYYFSGTLSIPPYTVLQGVNEYPFSSYGGGTVLLATSGAGSGSGSAFVYLNGPNAGVAGMSIYYPNQNSHASVPTPYPPCIQGGGDDLTVMNMLLVNPYVGIDFATNPCGRHLIENVYGQPIAFGIRIDQIYDIGRIRHIHFWPFWTSNAILNWIHNNGVTFYIMRTDWEVVEDVFSWGYNRGMVFDQSSHGACNGQFSNIDFDDVGIGIDVKHSQPYGLMFSNLNLANAGDGNNKSAISCPSNADANVQMVVRGLVVWGAFNQAVYWNCGGKIDLNDGLIVQWNKKYYAIEIVSGRANIRGMYFTDVVGNGIKIHSSVDRALVVDNDMVGNALTCDGPSVTRLCAPNLL